MERIRSAKSTRRIVGAVMAVTALGLTSCSSAGSTSARSGGGGATDAVNSQTGQADSAASAALPKKYSKAGVIRVASDMPNPPMEMRQSDGGITGFDYDLAQAMGTKLGVRMKFRQQAFDSAMPSLKAGKHDVIMTGMNDTPEREKTVDFVDYFHAGFMIIVKKGNPENIGSVLDLCGKTVAVQRATVQGELLRSYAGKCKAKGSSPIKLTELPDELDAQTAVRAGKAVADVVDASVASYAASTAGGGNTFELVKDPAHPSGYKPVYTGIAVLKGNDGLSNALKLALDSVMEDGTYKKLLNKYELTDFAIDKAGINRATE